MTDSKMTPDESFRAELAEWLRTEYDPDTAHADLISRALSYITTLEAERDRLVAMMTAGIALIDAAHAGCPVRQGKVKVRADECPKCGATTSDACGPVARCEYALSEDVRAALNPTGVGEAG